MNILYPHLIRYLYVNHLKLKYFVISRIYELNYEYFDDLFVNFIFINIET